MRDRFLKQAKHEYSPKQRTIFLLLIGPIFLFLLPYFFVWSGAKLDHWLQLPQLFAAPTNWILGILLILTGLLFGLWSNYRQFTLGRGTPVPLMATQELIVEPPYTYCRNPMALGAIVAYLGVGVLFRSPGALIVVLLLSALLLVYIKRIEEKEMELRFGQAYLDYKARTPFLIPRFTRHSPQDT